MNFKRTTSVLAVFMALSSAAFAFAQDGVTVDPPEKTVDGKYVVSANWSELKRGWNTLTVQISQDGTALTGAQVKIDYAMVSMPMPAPVRPVVEKDGGVYEKQVFPGMAGRWRFDIQIKKDAGSDHLSRFVDIR